MGIRLAVLAVLLPGCSLALAGDAISTCDRINEAVHAFSARCNAPYPGELQDCSEVLIGDGNSSSAEDCERELAARSCDDRSLIPEPCRLAYFTGF